MKMQRIFDCEINIDSNNTRREFQRTRKRNKIEDINMMNALLEKKMRLTQSNQ